MLEVDLAYPSHLQEKHSDYPLAPENVLITNDMLSPHTLQLREKLNIKGAPCKKLVPNLRNKEKYILHYKNLKFYLSQGLILTKIHKGISFTQSAWLKPYIDFNTNMRKESKSDFEKDFLKLMNNAVFGKTMEILRNRTNIKLVNNSKKMKKLCAKPSFKFFKIFNKGLVGVRMAKLKLKLNKPIYVGASILDLSIMLKYGGNAKLLFTDTDSLCYKIKTDYLYAHMYQDRHMYDTSNYDKNNVIYNGQKYEIYWENER